MGLVANMPQAGLEPAISASRAAPYPLGHRSGSEQKCANRESNEALKFGEMLGL